MLGAVGVVPAVLVLGYELTVFNIEREAAARTEVERIANAVAIAQKARLDGAREVLTAVAQLPGIRSDDLATCAPVVARLDETLIGYSRFAVLDRSGRIVCAGQPVRGSPDRSQRPFFRNVMASGEFSLGAYRIGGLSGVPVRSITDE